MRTEDVFLRPIRKKKSGLGTKFARKSDLLFKQLANRSEERHDSLNYSSFVTYTTCITKNHTHSNTYKND